MRHYGRHNDNHYDDGPDEELHVRPLRRAFVSVAPREKKDRAPRYKEVRLVDWAESPIGPEEWGLPSRS